MKTDMSGAAIVLLTLAACAELGVRVRVSAIAPLSENMPGSQAIKPGDVLAIRNGATIEVLNTDAEGRLVLADALVLATELEPDAIIDVATLTGAAAVALGTSIAALFANDDALARQLKSEGDKAGERLWQLPLPEEYADHIDSDVADMKNIGKAGQAGAIAAALLLSRFVGDTSWAHLDIAGTGRSTENSGYLSKGGTAFGVRTLLGSSALMGRTDRTPGVPRWRDGPAPTRWPRRRFWCRRPSAPGVVRPDRDPHLGPPARAPRGGPGASWRQPSGRGGDTPRSGAHLGAMPEAGRDAGGGAGRSVDGPSACPIRAVGPRRSVHIARWPGATPNGAPSRLRARAPVRSPRGGEGTLRSGLEPVGGAAQQHCCRRAQDRKPESLDIGRARIDAHGVDDLISPRHDAETLELAVGKLLGWSG